MAISTLMFLIGSFLVATSAEGETYSELRKPGINVGPPPHLFGPSVTAFSFDVFKSLSNAASEIEGKPQNLLFSPSSLYKSLIAVYLGSTGASKAKLATKLHLDNVEFDISQNYKAWRQLNPTIVREGDRLFYNENNNIEEKFRELLGDDIKGLPSKDPQSKIIVNDWASEIMGYKEKIIKAKQIRRMKLLPINLAFSKYNLTNTFPYFIPTYLPFSTSQDKYRTYDFIEWSDIYKYYKCESLKTEILSFQYSKSPLSFVILLPDEGQTVKELVNSLTADNIGDIFQNLSEREIVLQLPHIKSEQVHNITNMCETLDICDLLKKGNKDLQGITSDSGVFISDFIQKVGFHLFAQRNGPIYSPQYYKATFFRVQRPFLYMVYDNNSYMPVILGTVMNPRP